MRTSLTIFALAALCFGQDAFAQAPPKEVIVVDGQIAVNNLPESQTVNGTVSVDNLPAIQDVWVQGATNPIPTIDVTAPVGEPFFGTVEGPLVTFARVTAIPEIPDGKLLVLKNASVFANAHANVVPRCQVSLGVVAGQSITQFFDVTVQRFPTVDRASVFGSEQWDDLPAVDSAIFVCFIDREDLTSQTSQSRLTVSWSGYLYDAPTP